MNQKNIEMAKYRVGEPHVCISKEIFAKLQSILVCGPMNGQTFLKKGQYKRVSKH